MVTDNNSVCPFCRSAETRWVASLGELDHAECRRCGVVYALEEAVIQLEVEYLEELVTYDEHAT